MARFYGPVGFETEQKETEPSIYESVMKERSYYGDILQHQRRWDSSQEGVNDNLTVTNRISIVADAYMNDNWPAIKYVRWSGEAWKVVSIEVKRPRVILSLGGVWNGYEA